MIRDCATRTEAKAFRTYWISQGLNVKPIEELANGQYRVEIDYSQA